MTRTDKTDELGTHEPKTSPKGVGKGRLALMTVLALGLGLIAGCLNRDLRPLNPCTVSGVINEVKVTTVDKIDLLFLVDNSNSMIEEQTSLNTQFPRLIQTLASGEVTDSSGAVVRTFPAVSSLQVGVVDSDMGTGGFLVPTCTESNFGDDGILRTRGNTAIAGCAGSYPSFLAFDRATDDPATFATDFTCVAALGTGGCGFEQHLDGVLKALTPSTSATSFVMGTRGHGDVENAGFLRANSLLGIVVVADEDDCSASDPDLFNQSSPRYMGDLNLRCFQFPEAVYPTQRYVDGLLSLRPGSPELLVYAAIVGVPVDLVSNPDLIDFAAILADPRMQQAPDPTMPSRLTPSCNIPGRGLAFPPVRITQVAQGLDAAGAGAVVQSICQDDFTGAINAIINKLADVLGGACLPRALNPDSTGNVNCNVVEVLPSEGDFTTCDQLAAKGRTFERTELNSDGVEVQVCTVTQFVPDRAAGTPPTGPGWFYDDFSPDVDSRCGDDNAANGVQGQRISFTTGAEPSTGVTVRLECLQPVSATEPGVIGLATPCGAGAVDCGSSIMPGLFCNPASNTCTLGCASDADCTGAGLGGFVCSGSSGVAKCGTPDAGEGSCFCLNPTCGGM